ncbi:MAG: hypothetical protein Q4G40_08455 [Brachybacterium sp.]|nr:hypothetical protein [Brachybacterium sp.]
MSAAQPHPVPDRRRRTTTPPPLHLGRRHHLLTAGFDDDEIRHGLRNTTMTRLGHGLYTAGVPDDPIRETLRAITGDGVHVVSHHTAAALHGFALPWAKPGPTWRREDPGVTEAAGRSTTLTPPFHVTRIDGIKPMIRHRLVVGHQVPIPPEHLVERDGILLTSPAWTLSDLAHRRGPLELLILADQLVRHPRTEFGDFGFHGDGTALTSPSELQEVAGLRRGVRGVRALREAAALTRVGADSPRKTELRYWMHRAGLPEFAVNAPIFDPDGRYLHTPDLSNEDFRVAVEYDGRGHADPRQAERDVTRGERAADGEWLEVRLTDRHARPRFEPALNRIATALTSRGWQG